MGGVKSAKLGDLIDSINFGLHSFESGLNAELGGQFDEQTLG